MPFGLRSDSDYVKQKSSQSTTRRAQLRLLRINGSPQELVRSRILRGFADFREGDEFGVGDGRPFCFQ